MSNRRNPRRPRQYTGDYADYNQWWTYQPWPPRPEKVQPETWHEPRSPHRPGRTVPAPDPWRLR